MMQSLMIPAKHKSFPPEVKVTKSRSPLRAFACCSTKPTTTSSSKPASSSQPTSTSKPVSQTTNKSSSTSRSGSQTTVASASRTSIISSSYNSTYSTLHPITSWNLTATSTDGTWPPTKTLAGQTTICNAWHRVLPGDTCQRMLNRYGLPSVDDFLSWNPAVKEDCEMLIADYWVCVGVQRQVGNTDLEWETAQPEFTEPPEPTVYIPIELPTADSSFTPSPSHGPMPSNCKFFHQATASQNCNDLVEIYGQFSQQQFFSWNPALQGNCLGLWLDTYYCVGAYSDDNLPLPAHKLTKPTEGIIPLGYPNDCTRWYKSTVGDTCELISVMFGSFSQDEFTTWNPTVFSDCGGLVEGAWYCIGRPGRPTTRTSGAPSTLEPTETSTPQPATSSRLATTTTSTKVVASSSTRTSTSVVSTPTSKPISDNGICGGVEGKTCLDSMFGNCCSSGGYCGSSTAYCAAGCQSAFGSCNTLSEKQSPDGSCGGANGYTCLDSGFGDCCSEYGWCGVSASHCTVGCQAAFGTCTAS